VWAGVKDAQCLTNGQRAWPIEAPWLQGCRLQHHRRQPGKQHFVQAKVLFGFGASRRHQHPLAEDKTRRKALARPWRRETLLCVCSALGFLGQQLSALFTSSPCSSHQENGLRSFTLGTSRTKKSKQMPALASFQSMFSISVHFILRCAFLRPPSFFIRDLLYFRFYPSRQPPAARPSPKVRLFSTFIMK
jgi:hypothetical protein